MNRHSSFRRKVRQTCAAIRTLREHRPAHRMGSTVALEYQRPASRTHWGYPRQGQEGREESPRREASSRWTLSNETSILDHASPALMRTPLGCSQPHRMGHGFSLGLPDRTSPRTMTLTPLGVRHAPRLEKVKPANEDRRLTSGTNALLWKGRLGAVASDGNSTINRTSARTQVLKQRLGGYCRGCQ